MKKDLQEKAKDLRQKGWSLKEIVNEIKCSKGSVSTWVRNIPLNNLQKVRLKDKGRMFGNTYTSDHFRKKRKEYQQKGVELLNKHGYEFLCGCILYWAEGSKNKGAIGLINSDPNLLKYFLEFLYKFFPISKDNIRLHCTYYDGANLKKVEEFWLKTLELPRTCLTKSTKVISMRKNYPMGMAKILVYKTEYVQAMYGAIQHHCGFVNQDWLK